ncbi:hypothetical protein [Acinetobacter sp. ANC 4648]|uniref:hypothetical protein n=1 Tax=Acinetobacter sp. ANC 4648 TaxID=1977875 RepID=UPI000A35AA28|nr:hypothetical protein [Acinetobacter sp. ANC 4648]OTG84987.1 hypothetical protein B9T27_01860 [Acinetobacter sp. ANC 4648]
MTFQALLIHFQTCPSGTDSFKQLKNNCEQLIKNADTDLEHSSLFVIYSFAKNYVLLYEDQAITSEFSHTAKNQLLAYMQQLNQAIQTQDKMHILDTLNQVTHHYLLSSRIF